jgi:hypothetical protein
MAGNSDALFSHSQRQEQPEDARSRRRGHSTIHFVRPRKAGGPAITPTSSSTRVSMVDLSCSRARSGRAARLQQVADLHRRGRGPVRRQGRCFLQGCRPAKERGAALQR